MRFCKRLISGTNSRPDVLITDFSKNTKPFLTVGRTGVKSTENAQIRLLEINLLNGFVVSPVKSSNLCASLKNPKKYKYSELGEELDIR